MLGHIRIHYNYLYNFFLIKIFFYKSQGIIAGIELRDKIFLGKKLMKKKLSSDEIMSLEER